MKKLVLLIGLLYQIQSQAQVQFVDTIANYSSHWQYLDSKTIEHKTDLTWYQIKHKGNTYFRLINQNPKAVYDFKINSVNMTKTKMIFECENKGNPYIIQIRIKYLLEKDPEIMILSGDAKYTTRTFFYKEDRMPQ